MRALRTPSHGTVIAYLALFVALSGTAFALQKGSVGTKALKKQAVKTGKVGDGAITDKKLAAGSVTSPKLGIGAVGSSQLASGAVPNSRLASGAVGTGKLANGAVTSPKLAPNSVTGEKVLAGSFRVGDIARDVQTVTYSPGVVAADDCSASSGINVPGKAANQTVLVLPGAFNSGWNSNFVLDGWSSAAAAASQVRVRVCNIGAGADPGALPLQVLLFNP
jgi:hypothetical protein